MSAPRSGRRSRHCPRMLLDARLHTHRRAPLQVERIRREKEEAQEAAASAAAAEAAEAEAAAKEKKKGKGLASLGFGGKKKDKDKDKGGTGQTGRGPDASPAGTPRESPRSTPSENWLGSLKPEGEAGAAAEGAAAAADGKDSPLEPQKENTSKKKRGSVMGGMARRMSMMGGNR